MKDEILPLSNTLCEANIKPFATVRRTWLFADSPERAFANRVLYTLVASTRVNDMDVYEYLKYMFCQKCRTVITWNIRKS